jgi:hypothetical protein
MSPAEDGFGHRTLFLFDHPFSTSRNKSRQSARMLALCSPAGLEEFFREIGVPVATRTTPPPPLDEAAQAAFVAKAKALAPKYRIELLPP